MLCCIILYYINIQNWYDILDLYYLCVCDLAMQSRRIYFIYILYILNYFIVFFHLIFLFIYAMQPRRIGKVH